MEESPYLRAQAAIRPPLATLPLIRSLDQPDQRARRRFQTHNTSTRAGNCNLNGCRVPAAAPLPSVNTGLSR